MSRYFYDLKNDKMLTWSDIIDRYVGDMKYFLQEEDGAYDDYSMNDYIDDSDDFEEFDELFIEDPEYAADLINIGADAAYAYGTDREFVNLEHTLKELIDNSNYQVIEQAIQDEEFHNTDGTDWFCKQRGRDIIFY